MSVKAKANSAGHPLVYKEAVWEEGPPLVECDIMCFDMRYGMTDAADNTSIWDHEGGVTYYQKDICYNDYGCKANMESEPREECELTDWLETLKVGDRVGFAPKSSRVPDSATRTLEPLECTPPNMLSEVPRRWACLSGGALR